MALAPGGVLEELKDNGFTNIEDLSLLDQKGMTFSEHSTFKPDPNTKAIVLGLHKSFDFRKMSILALYL